MLESFSKLSKDCKENVVGYASRQIRKQEKKLSN